MESQAEQISETPTFWLDSGQNSIKAAERLKANKAFAKNVILFVGDGMGVSTINAARILEVQRKPGNCGGEENSLSFETAPYVALSKTYCANQQTQDSAPTMVVSIMPIMPIMPAMPIGL